jgi:hypothetical protein
MISPQTSYRFDNRNYTGRAKDSDEQQVTLPCRKTTTKRSQRREHYQLPHPWVHLRILFVSPYFESAPTRRRRIDGPGLAITRCSRGPAYQIRISPIGQQEKQATR